MHTCTVRTLLKTTCLNVRAMAARILYESRCLMMPQRVHTPLLLAGTVALSTHTAECPTPQRALPLERVNDPKLCKPQPRSAQHDRISGRAPACTRLRPRRRRQLLTARRNGPLAQEAHERSLQHSLVDFYSCYRRTRLPNSRADRRIAIMQLSKAVRASRPAVGKAAAPVQVCRPRRALLPAGWPRWHPI